MRNVLLRLVAGTLLVAVSLLPHGAAAGAGATDSGAGRVATEAPQIRCAAKDGLLLSIEPSPADPTRVLVRLQHDGNRPADARRLVLRLLRKEEAPVGEQLPPMGGRRTVEASTVTFRPVVPLVRGRTYRAEYSLPDSAAAGEQLTVDYRVPALPPSPAPRVVSIAPTGRLVPANHLKFYITFSEPMQRPGIFGWFRLKNLTTGEDVPRPFRHTELWSADQKQLTLWFHPGRQKTGVNLNVEIGAVLNEGHRYELVISGKWPSERGTPLGAAVTRQIVAGPADHRQPDLARWKIVPPPAGTRQPLVVQFDEPLDAALIRSQLELQEAAGQPVDGTATVRKEERQWEFLPREKWSAGAYRLAAGRVLEDLAGNSLERPFEVDVSDETAAEEVPPVLYRGVEISAETSAAR